MPLLRGQPFVRLDPPPDLKDDDEVFFCKITGEIFRDYEKYFERTILCNSLVWSCEMTGKSGLTFEEAIESERKSRIPYSIQRPVLYLALLTRRSRLSDLNDDVYGFIKEHYFLGEIVDVNVGGERKRCKIIKVISPPAGKKQQNGKRQSTESSDDDSIICLDDIPKSPPKKKSISEDFYPSQYEYVAQDLKKDTIYMVKGDAVSRKRTAYTREKSRMFLKQHCAHDESGFWKVKAMYMNKFRLTKAQLSEFFDGPPPKFKISKPGKRIRSDAGLGSSEEDKAIKRAKKEFKEKKKMEKSERKKLKNSKKAMEKKEKHKGAVVGIDAQLNADGNKFSLEEKLAMREQMKAKKLAERLAYHEEMKKKKEQEKQKKKEQRDKEREKRKEEKQLRDAYLREWNKPRDDLECDDLKDLPLPQPVQACIPADLFGDAVMVLEYLHCFADLVDYKSQFPNGISLDELGRAMLSTEVDGLFYDLLRMFLSTLFQLQKDEDDQEETNSVIDLAHGEDDEEVISGATAAYQLPQLYYNTSLKYLPVDSFTITEVLRLHFLSSGAKASETNARFRYQQRGGYSSNDDAGLEFRKHEMEILKELAESNVFDLEAGEKLKILMAMIHQILTYVASRDMIDDNSEQLRQVYYELRHHRWAEQRREKEEAAFWYKKRLEEKAKERELEQQRKEVRKKAKLDKFVQLEDVSKDDQSETVDESPDSSVVDRPVTRQKGQLEAKQDAEFFETPVENIQWDKISPKDRIKMKNQYFKKELELLRKVIELQHKVSISPLGRDRTFRRYWAFLSVPGLFVEDQEEHVPDDFFTVVNQVKDMSADNIKSGLEEKSTSSDKENDSFDLNKSSTPSSLNIGVTDNIKPLTENASNNAGMVLNSSVLRDEQPAKCIDVFQQIAQRTQVRWAYFSPDQLDSLINSLNSRGFREGALKTTLKEQRTYLLDHMKNTPVNEICKDNTISKRTMNRQQSVRLKKKKTQGSVQNTSAQEFLELNLREMLLDIEERIYVGSLGAVKVRDRDKWRDAIERGSYDPQNGETQPGSDVLVNGSINADDRSDDISPAVQDLAKALLQIERGVDPKYLTYPLGETEQNKKQKVKSSSEATIKSSKKKEEAHRCNDEDDNASDKVQKTALERWEESLVQSCSYAQIFLHLALLESSVAWSKSALHARCRICRRKGDGDKMLLCDGCDRGHHMYCLKPPVKYVPKGDWFCPDCRPKDIPKTPRKHRKNFFDEDEEDDEDDTSVEDEDSSSSSSDDDDDDDDDSDLTTETQEDTELDSTDYSVVTKVKLVNVRKKGAQQEFNAKSQDMSEYDEQNVRITRSTSFSGKVNTRSGTSNNHTSHHSARSKRRANASIENSSSQHEAKRSRLSLPEESSYKTRNMSKNCIDSSKLHGKRKYDQFEEVEAASSNRSRRRSTGMGHYSKLCEDLVMELYNRKESWPFLAPVSKRDAPDYFDIVKKPMDLSTIKNKINRYEYLNPRDMLEDVRLIFKNCFQYNMPTTAVYLAGEKLSKYFEKRIKEMHLDELLEKRCSPKKDNSPRSHRLSPRH